MLGYTIDQLKVGQQASFSKTVAESDVYLFAGISGDFNPAHINQAYAEQTAFKNRIAHGILSASFISTVIGCQLPGPGRWVPRTVEMKPAASMPWAMRVLKAVCSA